MRILVAGGGYAGLAAALRAKRKGGEKVDVTLVNDGPTLVERIRLHQVAVGGWRREPPIAPLLARAGVHFVQGRVDALQPHATTVTVNGRDHTYDRLVLALGSVPRVDGFPGAAQSAFRLDAAGAPRLHRKLVKLAANGGRVTVVGTGLCGLEAATEIAEAFPAIEVTLAGREGPLDGWSDAARQHALEACDRLGIRRRLGVDVHGLAPGRVRTAEGAIATDACVWAAGFDAPSLPWACGIAVDREGRVQVDAALRSISDPRIYAVGDIAAVQGRAYPMGCKIGMPMGAHAADNLVHEASGERPLPFDYGLLFFCASLGRDAGVIQWPDCTGALRGRTWTGKRAAWMKELVCRSTWWALALEAVGIPAVAWRQGQGGRLASSATLASEAAGD